MPAHNRFSPQYYVRNHLTRVLVAGPFSRPRIALAFAAERNRLCGARVYRLVRLVNRPNADLRGTRLPDLTAI